MKKITEDFECDGCLIGLVVTDTKEQIEKAKKEFEEEHKYCERKNIHYC